MFIAKLFNLFTLKNEFYSYEEKESYLKKMQVNQEKYNGKNYPYFF